MDDSMNKFETELNGLLKRYFNDDELSRLNQNINPPIEGTDNITGMINDFYKSHWNIN